LLSFDKESIEDAKKHLFEHYLAKTSPQKLPGSIFCVTSNFNSSSLSCEENSTYRASSPKGGARKEETCPKSQQTCKSLEINVF
jgi:hypothetical protein